MFHAFLCIKKQTKVYFDFTILYSVFCFCFLVYSKFLCTSVNTGSIFSNDTKKDSKKNQSNTDKKV